MSEKSTSDQDIQELLKNAITAQREGDKPRARALFEQVVELDSNNEKGWYWLASLVDTDAERRVCLGNVLYINPNNERARALLNRLEAGGSLTAGKEETDEIVPGINRRTIIMAGMGLSLLGVLLVALVLALISGQNREAEYSGQTAEALNATNLAVDAGLTAVVVGTEQALAATEVLEALSLTETRAAEVEGQRATFEAQDTQEVAETLAARFSPTPPPLPSAIESGLFAGRVLVSSGSPISRRFAVISLPLDGSAPQTFFDGGNFGAASPVLSPSGQYVAYTRFTGATARDGTIELAWADASQGARTLAQLVDVTLLLQDGASFSPDGTRIAFSAQDFAIGSAVSDIFVVDLNAALAGGDGARAALSKLTDGSANSTNPTWTDSSRLIYAAEVEGQTDLKLVNLGGGIDPLTNDGNALVEAWPDLSPDGSMVIYEAHSGNPNDTDLYLVPLGGGAPELLVDSDAADARPRWSPDGRAVVFSSNRTGDWEVYVLDMATRAIYRLTFSPDTSDVASFWAE